jgi:MFS family permease
MTPARLPAMLLVAAATTALAWTFLDLWHDNGGTSLPLPWTAVAGTAALVAVVVAAGLPVRRWVRGRRDRPLDPLVAARTVVLAKAAAYGGSLLCGWYAAQALALAPDLMGERLTRLVLALVAAVFAAGIAAAGLVVQRWCRVPPSDDDADDRTRRDDAA